MPPRLHRDPVRVRTRWMRPAVVGASGKIGCKIHGLRLLSAARKPSVGRRVQFLLRSWRACDEEVEADLDAGFPPARHVRGPGRWRADPAACGSESVGAEDRYRSLLSLDRLSPHLGMGEPTRRVVSSAPYRL